MNPYEELTGLIWSQARAALLERGFSDESLRVLDVTPPRREGAHEGARRAAEAWEWGETRVVRIVNQDTSLSVTIAREMRPAASST